MARPRTVLSDYNRMSKGFRYVVEYNDYSMGHGTIYAHSADDARIRLCNWPEVSKVWIVNRATCAVTGKKIN